MIDIKRLLIGVIFSLSMMGLQAQQKTDQEFLIGKWKAMDDPNSTIEFTKNGKSYWNYVSAADDINIHDIYTYTFFQEKSDNGVVFSYVRLVNIKDNSEVHEYGFSAGEKYLQLEYIGHSGVEESFFERIGESKIKSR